MHVLASPQKSAPARRIFTWMSGLLSFGLLGYLLLTIGYQILVLPPAASRLNPIQDIPLPSGLGPGDANNPLAPGVEVMFDGFDFQAYDTATHRLFIAHTGPSPDLLAQAHIPFDPHYDGQVLVFDTLRDTLIARIPLPQVAGIIDAPDLHKIFACTDFDQSVGLFENLIRVNPRTMAVIPADPHTMRLAGGPDLVRIDFRLHLVFVACAAGVTIFAETPGNFHRLGVYIVGKQTHTIAINEQTQEMYFPMDIGGRPVLRIERYNPNGR